MSQGWPTIRGAASPTLPESPPQRVVSRCLQRFLARRLGWDIVLCSVCLVNFMASVNYAVASGHSDVPPCECFSSSPFLSEGSFFDGSLTAFQQGNSLIAAELLSAAYD